MIRLVPHPRARSTRGRLKFSATGLRCRRKFLRFFPGGFGDATYKAWERDYKLNAHVRWMEVLEKREFKRLLELGKFEEIAAHATRIESRTNLLFSFEKMALRDAVRGAEGAKSFANGLYAWLHGPGSDRTRFEIWCEVVSRLPRKQTRVLTWPLTTVFGFLARPDIHMFLKPNVTHAAAEAYGYDFHYESRPNWRTYASLLDFAKTVLMEQKDLHAVDMIDAQSFIWVQGSSEYD
jgi:hypothetical protein